MCGRFTLTATQQEIIQRFLLVKLRFEDKPRFNIAPSQPVLAIRETLHTGNREGIYMNWGLIPAWADDITIGYKLTNARSETAAQKPSFSEAMKYRRCIIPASGFYEWDRVGKIKQPHYFSSTDGETLALAGLWEHWQHVDGSVIVSCTILTTSPNSAMKPIHNRMPVILNPKDFDRWLDPGIQKPAKVQSLLRPCPARILQRYPVSTNVNNARNPENPDMIKPITIEPPPKQSPQSDWTQDELF